MSVVTGLGYTFIHNGWMQKVITSLYINFYARWMNSIIFENTRDKNYFVANHLVDADKALSVKG
ncbi:MAG: hypothetical protein IPK25_00025 [Saprospiraceae bacterium]|nr:hypothetical protein [Saprospiraceae bacterium]